MSGMQSRTYNGILSRVVKTVDAERYVHNLDALTQHGPNATGATISRALIASNGHA